MTVRKSFYDPVREREELAASAEQLEQLRTALDLLSELDKRIVTLRFVDGLSNRMVAQTLGLTDQAASMRYLRAMRRLRTLMSDRA